VHHNRITVLGQPEQRRHPERLAIFPPQPASEVADLDGGLSEAFESGLVSDNLTAAPCFGDAVRRLAVDKLLARYGDRELELACDRVMHEVVDCDGSHRDPAPDMPPGFIPDDYWPDDSLQ
jgi:hypothetical protein